MAQTGDPDDAVPPPGPGFALALGHAWRTFGITWSTSRSLTLLIAALTVFVALLPALALYLSKLVIDGVVTAMDSGAAGDRDLALIWVTAEAAALALLLAARRLLVFYKTRLHAELGFAVTSIILRKSAALSLAQVEDAAIQQQLLLARQYAASRPYNLVNRLFDGAQQFLTLISVAALLWGFSAWLFLLVVAGGLPLFIGNLRFAGTAYRFYTGRSPQMRERSYLESLITTEAAARERLHFGFGDELLRRYGDLFESLHGADTALHARQAWIAAALGVLSSAVFLGGKVWIVWVTIGGAISLGQMTMLVGLLKQGQANVSSLLAAFNGVVEDLLYVANLFAVMELPEEDRTGGATEGPDPADGLRFENVSFSYPGRKRPALDSVSFHLPHGARLGIVGANGSGKTTLVKLVTGLYAPDSGRVTLDGLDLRQWQHAALHRRLGVMFQPFMNYKLSARDNIAAGLALAEIDEADILKAARLGLAEELIGELPDGLDTRLSRHFIDGHDLSGGQWQRLAMARAYLNEQADILILDEPTAAMDPAAEAEFMQRPLDGKSVILISHRLSNLRGADQIIVLDKGRLIEAGTHDALVAMGGLYAELFESQADPYREG
ncbi:ABC transporter ATP-binding protein [Maricaulis sp.]|uniref:ABC transporter ATP-binding protein n=1 Tax=Maricaulis sp. TaxID=1486257 RepID=UPI003A8CE1A5